MTLRSLRGNKPRAEAWGGEWGDVVTKKGQIFPFNKPTTFKEL